MGEILIAIIVLLNIPIMYCTYKSGYYRGKGDQLFQVVKILESHGIDPNTVEMPLVK